MLITPFSSDVSHPGKRFKAKSVEKKRGGGCRRRISSKWHTLVFFITSVEKHSAAGNGMKVDSRGRR